MIPNKEKAGYTLIELMVVVAIIGILGAVAIPGYIGYRTRAERSVAWTDLQSLRLLEEQFYAENNAYTGVLGDTATIRLAGNLPGFQPDPGSMYMYSVAFGTTADTQSFRAIATRAVGADVNAPYDIDNNNARNSGGCGTGNCW